MCMCRSPRMSSSRSARAACPSSRPRARRGSRAARAGCTACRAARRPPPRSRRRAVSPWRRRSRRTRSRGGRACTASVRSASLCLPEPVKCWSRLPKFSGGHDPQVDRQAVVGDRLDAGRARGAAPRRAAAARRTPPRAPPGRSAVATMSRSLQVSAMRRALPAISTRSPPGARAAPPPAPRRSRAPSRAAARALGVPSAPAASAASTFSSRLGAEARHVARAAPLLGGAAQVVERLDAERVVELARALGPEARECA